MRYLLIIALLFVASPVFASAIVGHAGLSDNLIACWDMNEESGTRADATANGYDLSDNNTVSFTSSGVLGNAADFTIANSEYLSITDAASNDDFDVTGDLSFSFWLEADAVDTMVMASKGYDAGSRTYKPTIERTSNQMTYTTSANCTDVAPATPSMTDPFGSGFVHVVYTFDASAGTGDFFFDGVDSGDFTGLHTSVCGTSALDFLIGARSVGTPDQFYGGTMDIVAVWDKDLTDDEVTTLYNSGTGIACAAAGGDDTFTQSGVIGYWIDKSKELKFS